MGGGADGARRAAPRGGEPPGSGCRGRCTGSSRSTPPTACCARRSSGTTSAPAAECDEIEARVGLERLVALTGNRALTGFTAPKLLWMQRHEPELSRADRARAAAEGLRPAAALRRARDRRRRRLRDAVARRRRARLERRGARALEVDPRVAAARARVAGGRGEPAAACPSPRARATRRRARSASASTGRRPAVGRARDVGASSSPRSSDYAPDPEARVHAFCHAVPGAWHAMGVMLSAAGLAARGCATRSPRRAFDAAARGGRGVAAGRARA